MKNNKTLKKPASDEFIFVSIHAKLTRQERSQIKILSAESDLSMGDYVATLIRKRLKSLNKM